MELEVAVKRHALTDVFASTGHKQPMVRLVRRVTPTPIPLPCDPSPAMQLVHSIPLANAPR